MEFKLNSQVFNRFQTAIQNKKFPHVLLLNTPQSSKLIDATKLIAGCLVCEEHQLFSCICQWHTKIKNNTYLDWYEIGDFKNNILRETILLTLERLCYTPYYKRKIKILVIKGVDFLTEQAATCLLKFLEEVKSTLYCFLLTTNRLRVLSTIISRSIIFDLNSVSLLSEGVSYPVVMLDEWKVMLKKIARGQKVIIDPNKLMALNHSQIKDFIFDIFIYLRNQLTSLLTLKLVQITMICAQQLESTQFIKRIIVYKWVNTINQLGSS